VIHLVVLLRKSKTLTAHALALTLAQPAKFATMLTAHALAHPLALPVRFKTQTALALATQPHALATK